MGYRHFKTREDFEAFQERIQEILYDASGDPDASVRKPVTLIASLSEKDIRLLNAYSQPGCFDRPMDVFYGDVIHRRLRSLVASGQQRYTQLQEKKKAKMIMLPDPKHALAKMTQKRKYVNEIDCYNDEVRLLLAAQKTQKELAEERGLTFKDLSHRPFVHRPLCTAMTPEAWQSIIAATPDRKEIPAVYCLFCGFMMARDILMCPRCGRG